MLKNTIFTTMLPHRDKQLLESAIEYIGDGPKIRFISSRYNNSINIIRNELNPSMYDVVLFHQFDSFSYNIQYAIKKIIEDHPNTIFIITTTNYDGIVAPIKNRCIVRWLYKINDDVSILDFTIMELKSRGVNEFFINEYIKMNM